MLVALVFSVASALLMLLEPGLLGRFSPQGNGDREQVKIAMSKNRTTRQSPVRRVRLPPTWIRPGTRVS